MPASFAHWPIHLRVAVAFQILGIFIYPLSIPVYSSLSIEFSSKLCLFRGTPSCASNSFSTPKSTRSSYIWNISASHWDGKKATFAQTTFCKCRSISRTYFLMHCESMESPSPSSPPINLNIWKKSWQNHFGKSIRDQHEVHFLAVRWNIYTNLFCDLICMLVTLSNNLPYLDLSSYQNSPKYLNPV